MSSEATSSSDESQESGLWLWHGKAPPPQPAAPPSPPEPTSRAPRILDPIVSAMRRGGWMALPGALALILLAVMLHSKPPDKPAPPVDAPAVALEPVSFPTVTNPIIPAPPVNIPAPRVELTNTQLDQAQIPSAPAALLPARGTTYQLAKKAAHHTSARIVRKTHSSLAHRGSPFLIRGVLTPPEPTVWHGGGY